MAGPLDLSPILAQPQNPYGQTLYRSREQDHGLDAALADRVDDRALPAADGLACFNRMYRLVIESVQTHVTAGFFGDPAWIARLDIVFANLYLKAFQGAQTAATPRSWAALVDRRADPRVLPLQFALAGMNAHINHDLPIALVQTCAASTSVPDRSRPEYRDFEAVNGILSAVEPALAAMPPSILSTAAEIPPFRRARSRSSMAGGNRSSEWRVFRTTGAGNSRPSHHIQNRTSSSFLKLRDNRAAARAYSRAALGYPLCEPAWP